MAVLVLGSMMFGSIAYAGSPDGGVKPDDILAKSPLYLMVKIGPGAACNKDLVVGDTDWACSNMATNYKGSIEAVEGTMTIASPINVGSNEVLTNDSGEKGTPSTKINFDFSTSLTKKFIIKLFPDENLTENGKLLIKLGGTSEPEEVSFAQMYKTGDFNFSQLDQRSISLIPLNSNLLKERSLQFKNKLSVATRMETMASWASAKLQDKKITPELYNEFAKLADAAWYKDYSDADVIYFNWRFNRLKKDINKEAFKPAFFYGGLNVLMKRFK